MTALKMLCAAVLAGFAACAAASGQNAQVQLGGGAQGQAQTAPSLPGATVTGRVICADTQRPARFALVNLLPAAASDDDGFRGRRLSGRTDLDGNFSVNNVPTGDYYVTGTMTGYVSDTQAVEAALSTTGAAAPAVPGVPVIHVGAGGASAQLSLQRGGVIAGTVLWDDGSPAAGVQVSTQAAASGAQGTSATQAQALRGGPGGFGAFNGTQTDDRGRYRLTGLAPGSYVVRAAVQAPVPQRGDDRGFTRSSSLFVYAPDKLRRTDASAITITAAEERDDVNVTLALATMHSVSGQVGSTGAAVRSGTVTLADQTDSTLNRTGYIAADGSFVITYVPAGSYTLTVTASSQAAGQGGRPGLRDTSTSGATTRFQRLQVSLTVTDSDVTGLSLNVTAANTSQ